MKTHQLLVAMLCASLPLLNGCTDTDNTMPEPTSESQPSLKLSVASVGNGVTRSRAVTDVSHEYSLENENAINNVLVLIYDKPLNSSAADAGSGKVKAFVYLNNLGSPTINRDNTSTTLEAKYYSADGTIANTAGNYIIAHKYDFEGEILPKNALTEDATYYAIALANVGNMGNDFLDMTVADLRDYSYTGDLCKANPGSASYYRKDWHSFVMSGVNEVKFTYSPDSETHVMTIEEELMVQRLAARIDVAFGDQAIYQNETTLDDWVIHPNMKLSVATDSDIIGSQEGNTSKYYPKKYDVEQLLDGSYLFPIYDYDYYLAHHTETNYKDVRITGALFKLWGIEIENRVPVSGSKTLLFQQAKVNVDKVYLANEGAFAVDDKNKYSSNFIYSETNTVDDAVLTYKNGAGGPTPYTVIFSNLFAFMKGWPGEKGAWANSDVWPFAFYSIIDYIGEHTFETHANTNTYTKLKLSGMCNLSSLTSKSNAPSRAEGDEDDSQKYHNPECTNPVEVTFKLRHSFGPGETADGDKNLCYAVVRNTIYRIYFRFYSSGNNLLVRWYWYTGSNNNLTQKPYETSFNTFILESNGSSPSND